MEPSQDCIDLIRKFEGLFLKAYKDPIDITTIGYGTIQYPDGTKVKMGDEITISQAVEYLMFEVNEKAKGVANLVKSVTLTQSQFDALVSFSYNVGLGNFRTSTLLKKILLIPNQPSIWKYTTDDAGKPVVKSCEFLKWVYASGKIFNGLIKRRAAEADLYAKDLKS